MILAIGFRVRSVRGTQFRQWAHCQLKEYITEGFVMDDLSPIFDLPDILSW